MGTHERLEPPTYKEDFDKIHSVRINKVGGFAVEDWINRKCISALISKYKKTVVTGIRPLEFTTSVVSYHQHDAQLKL